MKTLFPLFLFGLIVNIVGIFVVFAPQLPPSHPECSVAGFHPDLSIKQRAFCREWNKK